MHETTLGLENLREENPMDILLFRTRTLGIGIRPIQTVSGGLLAIQ